MRAYLVEVGRPDEAPKQRSSSPPSARRRSRHARNPRRPCRRGLVLCGRPLLDDRGESGPQLRRLPPGRTACRCPPPAADDQPPAPAHSEPQHQVKPVLASQPEPEPPARRIVRATAKLPAIKGRARKSAEPADRALCESARILRNRASFRRRRSTGTTRLAPMCVASRQRRSRRNPRLTNTPRIPRALLRLRGADQWEPPVLRVFARILNTGTSHNDHRRSAGRAGRR